MRNLLGAGHRAKATVLMRIGLGALITFVAGRAQTVRAASSLKLAQTVPLPQVKGGFDLMAADVAGKRLFVAAEDNNTMEVIDLDAGKHLRSVSGFAEPKWVVYRPESHRLYVSCGGDGTVRVLDSKTFEPVKKFEFKEKANNLRYDAKTKELFVGVGKTFGAIGVIDTGRDAVKGEIRLVNFPKQFELEGNRVYVNVPEANHVAVLDRKAMKVAETWPIAGAKGNVPMGFDRKGERLFLGCETGKLVVMDSRSGKCVANVDIAPEPDGVWYDGKRKRVYVSCGEGVVDVVRCEKANKYELMEKVATAKGAATSLLIPEMDRLCVAVPQREGQQAEMRIFETAN